MKNVKRILSGLAVAAMMAGCIACGAIQQGSLTETAAVRSVGVGANEIYIDDSAIALARQATTTDTLNAATVAAFNLTNTQRKNANLRELNWSSGLADSARVRAQEIVISFSHTRPSGAEWWTVNSKIQYGENLAKLYNSADSVVAAWMASPTHKANILDGGFKTIGISVHQAANGNWYWAQEFGY